MSNQFAFIIVIGLGGALFLMSGLLPFDAQTHFIVTSTAHDLCIGGLGGLSPHIAAGLAKAVKPTQDSTSVIPKE